ncbi:hypothetical protein ACFQ4O_01470 [Methylopila musalis]|uniref:Porin n=1 Tax=Methylopila musalis TaxID=1134781 RepID=A0ABW3Z373_9HYPH
MASALALCGAEVEAGAYTQPAGQGQAILSGYASEGAAYYDRRGRLKPRGRFSKRELQLYVEYGLTDAFTLVGAGALQRISSADEYETSRRQGFGRTEIGLRARLWTDGRWVVSAQGSGALGGAKRGDGFAAVGEQDDQLDARVLVARSFSAFGGDGFVDVAAGYRARFGDPADEARLDATLGWRKRGSRWLWLTQSFSAIGLGRWSGPYPLKQRTHKIQTGAVYDLRSWLFVHAAGFVSVAGRDSLDEKGAMLGVGCRF